MSISYEAAYDAFGGKEGTEKLLAELRSMGMSEDTIAAAITPYFRTAPTPPTKDLQPPEGPPPFAPDKVVPPEEVTSLPKTKTFSDEITAGTPTTQDEFLSAISTSTTAPDTITPIVAKAGSGTTYTGTDWPSIIYGSTDEDGRPLTQTTTSDGTPFYLHDTDEGGYYQNPDTVESYAPFTGEDGKTYYAVYAPTFSSGKAWNETPVTSVLTESQYKALKGGDSAIGNLINSPVGSFALNLLGPYGQLINAANAASNENYTGALLSGLNAAGGFGYTDIGGVDLQTAKNAASLLNAVDKNNLAGALTAGSNLLGGVPGDFQTAGTLATATLALKNNDTAGFLNSIGELTGSSDAKVAAAAVKLKDVLESGNTAQLNSALTNFTSAVGGTSTSGTSGSTGSNITTLSAEDLQELNPGELQAYEANGVQGLSNFRKDMKLLNSLTGSGYTGDSTGGDYTPDTTTSGLPTGVLLASLDGGLGTTNLGGVSGTTFPDLTNDATIKSDADLFNSTIGTLDQLDSTRTSDEFADFLESIGITSLDQLTDSGLSNQDILDMINATDDTVTVTGKTDGTGVDGVDTITGTDDTVTVTGKKDGTDTTGTTITGTDGTGLGVDDKGTVTVTGNKEFCPVGTVLNPETGECDTVTDEGTVTVTGTKESCPVGTVLNPETGECDTVTDEGTVTVTGNKEFCPVGTVLNPETGECDVVEDKGTVTVTGTKESCPVGTVLNPETGECDAIEDKTLVCDAGYHEENGVCVKDTLTCPEGKVLNADGTACIDEIVITDKKCDPGFVYDEDLKMCVPIVEECLPGFHMENGSCVPDEVKCETGYHLENGVCVKDALVCAEGFQLNEAGTECIPVVKITECKEGFHRDETGACVPDEVKCETGYHLENGMCVPDAIKCETGYHEENGVCVKDKLECPEGYQLNDAGTECIPVVKITECKEGFHRNAEGVCVPDTVECEPGYHLENGVCVKDKLVCAEGFELNEAGTECIPVVKITECKEGFHRDETGACVPDTVECSPGYHLEDGKCVKDKLECPEGYELNDAGTECIPVIKIEACKEGYHRNEEGVCVPDTEECAEGFHLEDGICVADDDGKCETGYEKFNGACVPVCKEGYIRNLETGTCEKPEDKPCPVGQVKDANGKCVPIARTTECNPGYEKVNGVCVPVCQTGYQRVNGVCTPIPKTATTTGTAVSGQGETIDPIYATGMDDFDLFATLEELLNENSDKSDKKKDSKKSKEKTKMATGGHLDDLLAEQMTVDDLLKLLR